MSSPRKGTNQFVLLTARRFLPLFLTQFLGAFNDNFFKSALMMLITYRLGDAAGVDPRRHLTWRPADQDALTSG